MHLLDLTIGTRHFFLPEDTNSLELEAHLEDAVRRGGAMVSIPRLHGQKTSALITPVMPVYLDEIDAPDGDDENVQDDSQSAVEFEYDGIWSS